MDPITAIGLLGSLSNLIQASASLLDILKSFKDGDRELVELFNDVSVFAEALKGFDRVLRSRQTTHKISMTVISNALEEASRTVQELDDKVTHVSKFGSSTIRRMKWVQHKTSIMKLQGHVKDQSAMLQSFLTLAHAYVAPWLIEGKPYSLRCYFHFIAGYDNHVRDISIFTTANICGYDRFFRCKLRPTAAQDIVRSLGSSTTELDRENPTDITTKRRFSRAVNLCTDRSCQASNQTTDTASTFFRKALAQVASSRCVKVRYDLNTFRMVSEGSDAMRYVKHGNLDKLKMCVQTGEASLWDTAPDGWSLLHVSAGDNCFKTWEHGLSNPAGSPRHRAYGSERKPADLAILKSFGSDATDIEREIVEVFSKKDDYVRDFDFTPIHIVVLDLYDAEDRERPSLEQLIELVDDCNNAPAGTDWGQWKLKYRRRSNLFSDTIELFRSAAFEKPKTEKIIQNVLDQKDKKYHWTPLHWASSAGHSDKMRVLVKHGADPFILSNLDANILHAAAESKTTSGLDGALEIWRRHPQQLHINQANRWAETPLHVAAWGSLKAVQKLLEAGADRNVQQEDGQVPLHCAGLSEHGQVRRNIVTLLCGESGPHVNTQDVDGRPPLFDFLDDPVCIQALVEHGARVDLLDSSGKSVFHHACIQDEDEALETLLSVSPTSRSIVTMGDHTGNTALIDALLHGSIDCAMVLLKLDNVGEVVGRDGWSAAHHAAKIGDPSVLEAVLEHPSFVKGSKTVDGKTVEVVAMEAGNWCGEMRSLLREHNTIM
ncbi:MAG: hypothetical protein Q9169_003283 [Polycauliona sp. 2 TL-2023]